MEFSTCRTFCSNCLPRGAEAQQEKYAQQSIQSRNQQSGDVGRTAFMEKNVFSFKLHQHRTFQHSDKHTQFPTADARNARLRSAEIGPPVTGNASPTTRFYSPTLKEQVSVQLFPQPTARIQGQNLNTLYSPRASLQPKVIFNYNTATAAPATPVGKMVGKRLRTNEQETQYSSKHSQIIFKTAYQIPENSSWVTFQKEKEHLKQAIFQQSSEQSQPRSQQGLQIISERMLSSQQQSHSPAHIEHYHNGPTVQTIITSTEIKSRNSSRFSNQLRMLRDVREERMPPHLSFDAHGQQNCSITVTPTAYFSPREDYTLPNDPSLFEGSARQNVSPRISVLSLSKHRQNEDEWQEQLRDVIDHNFLISQPCSRNNSPKVSLNPSLKNVSDHEHSDRRQHLSPFHSRESSWQMGPLMSTQAKFRRTNTIESIESFSSEMISCLDIKFMQKNKGRRGVSRLI